jgi:hypothetical protein
MTNVVQLIPHGDDQPASSDQFFVQAIEMMVALMKHVISLEQHVRDLTAENIVHSVRIGLIESTRPAPRFEVPEGWISVRQAVSMFGAGRSTISRLVQRGKIIGADYNGRTFIDPESLQRWIETKVRRRER